MVKSPAAYTSAPKLDVFQSEYKAATTFMLLAPPETKFSGTVQVLVACPELRLIVSNPVPLLMMFELRSVYPPLFKSHDCQQFPPTEPSSYGIDKHSSSVTAA